MKLWEINDKIEAVLNSTAQVGGELSEVQEKELDELLLSQRDKILACALYMQGEEAEAMAIEVMGKKLMARAKVHRNRAEWLMDYMERHAPPEKEFEIDDPRVKIGWKTTQRVESEVAGGESKINPEDLSLYDARFVREKTVYEIDKAKAKPVLKAGQTVRGLILKDHRHLAVSPRVREEE